MKPTVSLSILFFIPKSKKKKQTKPKSIIMNNNLIGGEFGKISSKGYSSMFMVPVDLCTFSKPIYTFHEDIEWPKNAFKNNSKSR